MSNKYDEAIKAAEYNRLAAYDAADRALDGACHPAFDGFWRFAPCGV